MDVNYYSTDEMSHYISKFYSKTCTRQSSEQVGYLFKAQGYGCDGPSKILCLKIFLYFLVGPASEEYLYELGTCPGRIYTPLDRIK